MNWLSSRQQQQRQILCVEARSIPKVSCTTRWWRTMRKVFCSLSKMDKTRSILQTHVDDKTRACCVNENLSFNIQLFHVSFVFFCIVYLFLISAFFSILVLRVPRPSDAGQEFLNVNSSKIEEWMNWSWVVWERRNNHIKILIPSRAFSSALLSIVI